MTDREELEIAVKALDSKKAKNITALKVDDLTILANYFVIASASSTTQVKALADEVEYPRLLSARAPLGRRYAGRHFRYR